MGKNELARVNVELMHGVCGGLLQNGSTAAAGYGRADAASVWDDCSCVSVTTRQPRKTEHNHISHRRPASSSLPLLPTICNLSSTCMITQRL
jgi:hypothetical protein